MSATDGTIATGGELRQRIRSAAFLLGGAACLLPMVSAAVALVGGAALGLSLENPWPEKTRALTHRLLTLSIVGLGAGMNLAVVGLVGAHGVLYTALGISLTLLLGWLISGALRCEPGISVLVSVGTAICGGSAIAAVAPVIQSKNHEMSVALATVFLLNAVALVIFPPLGHALSLTQTQFGLWCALAIHDTSSVVGATMQYGNKALEIGTTVKLARALWIVPVTLAFAAVSGRKREGGAAAVRKPWFILGFLVAAAAVTWLPALQSVGHDVAAVARRTLVVALFLIGTSLSRRTLAAVGARPLLQGFLLWIIVGCGTLAAIKLQWLAI